MRSCYISEKQSKNTQSISVSNIIKSTPVAFVLALAGACAEAPISKEYEQYVRASILQPSEELLLYAKVSVGESFLDEDIFAKTSDGQSIQPYVCIRDGLVLTDKGIHIIRDNFEVPEICPPPRATDTIYWHYADIECVDKVGAKLRKAILLKTPEKGLYIHLLTSATERKAYAMISSEITQCQ